MKTVQSRAPYLLLALPMLALSGCGSSAESAAGQQTAQQVLYTADTATVAVPLSLPAQLYVEHDTWVYARTTGVVESLYVDLGSEVRAGDLLAQLEKADQLIAAQQAEVAYENARRELERQRSLAQSRLVAVADSERAELEFRRAELGRQQARRNLELTRVTAPFAGAVSAKTIRPARLVAPGDSLFRVTALAPLRVAVHVPEGAARGIGVGSSAYAAGLDGAGARATVIRASPNVDAASGTREFILELAPGARMRPGASVTVSLGGERRQVIAIPAAAVADSGYVLVWEDGRTALRAVTLGARLRDGRIEVVSGLARGERLAQPR
ncbi:MAG: efflux RND transporter periplasmic adaptor subunit [Gemmatimonadetes bacterium]|nr:efflux RND transporter periplasmic adaptor subunit [Gemmatimonadota bacterium]